MAQYPGTVPVIPADGSWTHGQVVDELNAALTALGVNPRGAQADVAGRLTVHESRLGTVEAATSLAGVEIGAATLATVYDIKNQAQVATFTDIGLTLAVPAQTRAYNITFSCNVALATSASFVAPKYASAVFRIVDSAVTTVCDVGQFPIIPPVAGAQSIFVKALMTGRVPPGQPATTWKVQVRAQALDAQISSFQTYTGPLAAPAGGVSLSPALLQAVTV